MPGAPGLPTGFKVATRFAAQLCEPAVEILQLGEQNAKEVATVDGALGAILEVLEENPPTDEAEREGAAQLFDSVENMVHGGRGIDRISEGAISDLCRTQFVPADEATRNALSH
jgi:hypothetical protein